MAGMDSQLNYLFSIVITKYPKQCSWSLQDFQQAEAIESMMVEEVNYNLDSTAAVALFVKQLGTESDSAAVYTMYVSKTYVFTNSKNSWEFQGGELKDSP